ncbi:AraC family transcriptional regulator [Vagococcus acidifermentans]|nr:AraC family transcriptional regulator [Vagococcus acidifermentans]
MPIDKQTTGAPAEHVYNLADGRGIVPVKKGEFVMENIVDRFNDIVAFIEEHLTEKIDYEEMGKNVGYSPYHLQRLFLMLSNVPISEYIRCRRLACSAHDLLDENNRVTDIAYKYGYSSPTSFNRAFKAFHGITPKDIKKKEHFVKAYPPLSLEVTVKGAAVLDYKIVRTECFRIIGKKIRTTMKEGRSYREIPAFWGELQMNKVIPSILSHMNQAPVGLLGISDYNPNIDDSKFDYYIGVSSTHEAGEGWHELTIAAATWATFKHQGATPEEIQACQCQIVMDWLPTSGYEFAAGPDLEVYGEDNTIETWIPVTRILDEG